MRWRDRTGLQKCRPHHLKPQSLRSAPALLRSHTADIRVLFGYILPYTRIHPLPKHQRPIRMSGSGNNPGCQQEETWHSQPVLSLLQRSGYLERLVRGHRCRSYAAHTAAVHLLSGHRTSALRFQPHRSDRLWSPLKSIRAPYQ